MLPDPVRCEGWFLLRKEGFLLRICGFGPPPSPSSYGKVATFELVQNQAKWSSPFEKLQLSTRTTKENNVFSPYLDWEGLRNVKVNWFNAYLIDESAKTFDLLFHSLPESRRLVMIDRIFNGSWKAQYGIFQFRKLGIEFFSGFCVPGNFLRRERYQIMTLIHVYTLHTLMNIPMDWSGFCEAFVAISFWHESLQWCRWMRKCNTHVTDSLCKIYAELTWFLGFWYQSLSSKSY